MSEDKPYSSAERTSRIPRVATKTPLTPVPPAVAPAPDVAQPAVQNSSGSLPPPPPSRRPVSERPMPMGTSPLPPPISVRPPLPKAPPVARVGKQHPSPDDLKRLEDENQSLRKRLVTQREEMRVEHKNVERLRSELAHLKAKLAAPRPISSTDRNRVDELRANHLREIREIKQKHQWDLDELHRAHRTEIAQLKRDHQAELAQRDKKAVEHENRRLSSTVHDVEDLRRQIEDLKKTNTTFRQKNTELREANGDLEKKLSEARAHAERAHPAAQDDLTQLKGVGPKVAQALRAAGITTFEQIAAWTNEDIDSIAPRIKTAATRIRNADWVGQAQKHFR